MSPRWLHWPAPTPVVAARYSVSGELLTYSSTRYSISNPVESGSDADWWSRFPTGEFRKISDNELQWILLRDAINNPYANVAAFIFDFNLDNAVLTADGSLVNFSSVSWVTPPTTNNLAISFSGSGYNALWNTLAPTDPVSLSIYYS